MTVVVLAGNPEYVQSQISQIIGLGNTIYSLVKTNAKYVVVYGV
jgi:hypothetical protein